MYNFTFRGIIFVTLVLSYCLASELDCINNYNAYTEKNRLPLVDPDRPYMCVFQCVYEHRNVLHVNGTISWEKFIRRAEAMGEDMSILEKCKSRAENIIESCEQCYVMAECTKKRGNFD